MQIANDTLQFYNGMTQRHGIVRWNMAMFFQGDHGKRFVTVPLEKDSRILSVIVGELINGTYHFYFYTKASILDVINNSQSTAQEYFSVYLPALSIIVNDRLYFSRPNPILSGWMEQEGTLMDKHGNVVSRGEDFRCDMVITHWYQVNPDGDDYYLGASYHVECFGDNVDGSWMNPGSGPNITDGSNTGSGGNPGDGDPNNESEPDGLIDYLTPAQLECLWKGLEQSAVLALTELIQSTFYEGCEQMPTQTVVDNILEELCNQLTSGDLFDFDGPADINGAQAQEAVLTLISGEDVFATVPEDIIQANFAGCEYLGCVWNAITNNSTYNGGGVYDNFLCDKLSIMSNAVDFVLMIIPSNFSLDPNVENSANGYTAYSPISPKTVVIAFNTDNCGNNNVFTAINLILHETIHAHILHLAKTKGHLNSSGTNVTEAIEALSMELINDYYAPDPQHYLMLTYFLDDMKETIYKINGQIGSPDDYLGLILNSFGAHPSTLTKAGFNTSSVNNATTVWNNFLNDSNNFHPTLFNMINNCYEP